METPDPAINYEYYVYFGSSSFSIPSYLVTECNDAVITTSYTVTPALPASVTFDNLYTFTMNSNTVSDTGIYTITFK